MLLKRADLLRRINKIAKARGVEVVDTEGGSHTKVQLGDLQTVVPRHNEINEHTARGILRHLEGESG